MSGLEDCFDMLHQWLSKKVGGFFFLRWNDVEMWQEERTSINNWPVAQFES